MRACLPAVCALVLWLTPEVAGAAVPCRVDGAGPLRVQIGERVAEGARVIADCTGLKALTDGVLACYYTAEGRPECAQLAAGAVFEPAEASRRAQSVFRKIMRVVEGARESRPGGLRAASGERRPGYPYGKVHARDGALVVGVEDGSRIDLFVLNAADRRGPPVFQARNATSPLRVPHNALQAGASYTWQARVGAEQFGGGFRMVDAEQHAEVVRDIQAIRENRALSPDGQRFMEAVVYEYHGLEADAARAARGLRTEVWP